MNGTLTDVAGLHVGHWTDLEAATGCTVILCPPQGAVAGVDVRGFAFVGVTAGHDGMNCVLALGIGPHGPSNSRFACSAHRPRIKAFMVGLVDINACAWKRRGSIGLKDATRENQPLARLGSVNQLQDCRPAADLRRLLL